MMLDVQNYKTDMILRRDVFKRRCYLFSFFKRVSLIENSGDMIYKIFLTSLMMNMDLEIIIKNFNFSRCSLSLGCVGFSLMITYLKEIICILKPYLIIILIKC